jgi:hypothetical protein
MAWTPTHAQLNEVFTKHLPYEIGRLVEAYRLLVNPEKYYRPADLAEAETIGKALVDAHIVSFCTHARNLLEFFPREEYNDDNHYARAADFSKPSAADPAKPNYEIRKRKGRMKELYKQLCAQVNHLTYDRTDEDSKKITEGERKELIDIVYEEVLRLARSLDESRYDKLYLGLGILADAAKLEIKVGLTKQPSSEVIVKSWKSPSPPLGRQSTTGTVIMSAPPGRSGGTSPVSSSAPLKSGNGMVTFNILK